MHRSMLLAAGAAIAVVLALPFSASGVTRPKLVGTVGPGFTITLKKNGVAVKSLKAGPYLLVVHDKGSIHSFVIEKEKGGTFEKTITSVPFVGTKTFKIRLTAGKWEVYCRPHEAMMHKDFTVK
jgi:hypothetical protein